MRIKPTSRKWSGYFVAIVATGVAAAIRMALHPFLGDSMPFLLFPVAITVAAFFGGFGPGVVATALSLVIATYFFIPPQENFAVANLQEWFRVGVFVVTGLIISWLCELLHVTRRKLELEETRLHRSIDARRQIERDMSEEITERRLSATRLEESEQRFRILIEALTSIVWVTDAEGRFAGAQDPWCAYTGQTPEAYAGFGWLEAIHPDDRASVAELW